MKALLHNRNFIFLWTSQIISGIGDILYSAGIMVNVYQLTGSAVQTVGVMVATALPAFLISPFAGAIVDAQDRKLVLIVMDMVRAALVTGLLLFINDNAFNLWGLYAVLAGLSAASAFYRPAKMAIIPTVVSKEKLGEANALLMGTTQAIWALGFGLGGILALYLGIKAFIFINMGTFLVSALLTYFIKTPHVTVDDDAEKKQVPIWQSIKEGYASLAANKVAYPLVVMEIMEFFPHGIWTAAILLAFVERSLQGTPQDWGFVMSTYFGSMLLGAFVAAYKSKQLMQSAGWVIIINAFFSSLLTIAFAYSPSVFWAIIITLIFGAPNSIRDVTQDTLLQTTMPQQLLGRVYAMRGMLTNMMFMLGGVFFAWLADTIAVHYVYLIGGILYFVTAVYALNNAALRNSKVHA